MFFKEEKRKKHEKKNEEKIIINKKTKKSMKKKQTQKIIIAIIITIIITTITIKEKQEPKNDQVKITTYFCPPTNCSEKIIRIINNSKEAECAFYEVKDKEIIDILRNKELIIDENNKEKIEGAKIRKGKGIMHNKYCIINKTTIITGSYNPTNNNQTINNIVIIESKKIAKQYHEAYEQLLRQKKKPSKTNEFKNNNEKIEAYHCPQDPCQEAIIKKIREANKSISFALFTFTDEEISQELIKKKEQGITIKGIIESYQRKKLNQYYTLKKENINVTLERTNKLQHNKIWVIDEKIIITGSYNPTKAAHTINDENIIIIENKTIAKKYEEKINELIKENQ